MASPTQKAKFDPLEAAKLVVDAPAPPPQPPQRPVLPERAPPPPQPEAEAITSPQPSRRARFRVAKAHRVSIRGNICDFKEGRVIDSAGYDIEALRAQGLRLEPMED